jgi:hypothetical protein
MLYSAQTIDPGFDMNGVATPKVISLKTRQDFPRLNFGEAQPVARFFSSP